MINAPGSVPSSKRIIENQSSMLLSNEENETVFKLMGNKCQCLAAAVVQVMHSESPSHTRWVKRYCGVACFVKDNGRRSYFIRIYDIDKLKQVWEQELYTNFTYSATRPYFHTFEAETCNAGLNFADEQEASKFHKKIDEKLRMRTERSQRRRAQSTVKTNNMNNNNFPTATGVLSGYTAPQKTIGQEKSSTISHKTSKREKVKKVKITKADISEPTNFQHLQHVGWDPNTGFDTKNFDLEKLEPAWQELLTKAGVTDQQLQDHDTRRFIYEFMDGYKNDLQMMSENTDRPPVPARPPPSSSPALSASVRPMPPTPPSRRTAPPPPPSLSHEQKASPTTMMRQTAGMPPPPPVRNPPSIPTPPAAHRPPIRAQTAMQPPPVPSAQAVSQPLPPPPPPPPPPPEVPPMLPDIHDIVSPTPPAVTDNHAALLSDIRKGMELKPVQPSEPVPAAPTDSRDNLLKQIRQGIELRSVDKSSVERSTSQLTERDKLLFEIRRGVQLKPVARISDERSLNVRDQLLSQIRQGVELKAVDRVTEQARPDSHQDMLDGIAGALAKALADRARVIHSSDESEEEDDDDDEWED